jgi:hypothetical protein
VCRLAARRPRGCRSARLLPGRRTAPQPGDDLSRLTAGNKTEAVALAMRRLLDQHARVGSLFGAHPGSVRVRSGVDLIAPALDVEPDAASGREIER